MTHKLVIGSVEVALESSLDFSQTYETLGGMNTVRMMDGTAKRQSSWKKLKSSVSASGWIPSALSDLDYTVSMTVKCVAPRAVQSPSNAITLPSTRRTDTGYTPYGFAIVDGKTVSTEISLVGNLATLTAVPSATAYRVNYYPEFVAFVNPPQESVDVSGAAYSWTIEMEQV